MIKVDLTLIKPGAVVVFNDDRCSGMAIIGKGGQVLNYQAPGEKKYREVIGLFYDHDLESYYIKYKVQKVNGLTTETGKLWIRDLDTGFITLYGISPPPGEQV